MRGLLVACMVSRSAGVRSVVLVRHGISEMNMAMPAWGSPGFADPEIRDAPLTAEGLAGARALREAAARDFGDVELVVSSPLTRALQTCDAVWDVALASGTPAVALPLAAERCYLSSDVGTPRGDLERAWGARVSFPRTHFPDGDCWWYGGDAGPAYAPAPAPEDDWRPPGTYCALGEPLEAFRGRMAALVDWLAARPEETVALTCHWGVIMALTGRSFRNCEARRVPLADLRVRADVAY